MLSATVIAIAQLTIGPQPTKHKILEVTRESRGLKVWYLGETFLLPRLEENEDR